jgi:hypothetical protein
MDDPNGWRHSKEGLMPQNPRLTRESTLSARSARRRVPKQPFELGYQLEGPLTAARSITCRMAYGKILLVGRSW